MFSLEWWNYALMGAVVFFSASIAGQILTWREAKRDSAALDGPCGVHLGTQESGAHLYCGRLDGHRGTHGGEVLVTYPQGIMDDVQPSEGDGHRDPMQHNR